MRTGTFFCVTIATLSAPLTPTEVKPALRIALKAYSACEDTRAHTQRHSTVSAPIAASFVWQLLPCLLPPVFFFTSKSPQLPSQRSLSLSPHQQPSPFMHVLVYSFFSTSKLLLLLLR